MLKKSFKINSEIYDIENITQSIKDFSDFDVFYNSSELVISGDSLSEIEQIFNELMNYCLALHNELI